KIMADGGGPPWDRDGLERLRDKTRAELNETTLQVVLAAEQVLTAAYEVEQRLAGPVSPALRPAVDDMRTRLAALVYPGVVAATGWERLRDLLRYLRAIERRLEKLPQNPARDRDRMLVVAEVREEYEDLLKRLPPERRDAEDVRQIRWMIEELRVSLFAQTLGTPYPVSDTRIYRAIDAVL